MFPDLTLYQFKWFFADQDDLVGRTPRSAADPLVGLLGAGIRSSLVTTVAASVGQIVNLRPIGNIGNRPGGRVHRQRGRHATV
jgi:hypothetical protein